jgi:hypothetical protein
MWCDLVKQQLFVIPMEILRKIPYEMPAYCRCILVSLGLSLIEIQCCCFLQWVTVVLPNQLFPCTLLLITLSQCERYRGAWLGGVLKGLVGCSFTMPVCSGLVNACFIQGLPGYSPTPCRASPLSLSRPQQRYKYKSQPKWCKLKMLK